jgi:hypothetical protein
VSALTKVFVILLVVCSLLLSAGLIVFVNNSTNYTQALEQSSSALDAMRADRDAEKSRVQAQATQIERLRTEAAAAVQARQTEVAAAQKAAADKDVQIATLNRQLATQGVQLTAAAEGMQSAQAAATQLTEEVAQLRQTTNETIVRNTELNQALNERTAQLEATERERRFLAEQLTQSQQAAASLSAQLADAGLTPSTAYQATGPASAPLIRGAVTETRPIGGVPYATINVGASDGVQRGMEFKVVQGPNFLGTLTVEMVDAKEATGRLQGPRVEQIRNGTEVTTQIRG